jgi:hypothetical protein
MGDGSFRGLREVGFCQYKKRCASQQRGNFPKVSFVHLRTNRHEKEYGEMKLGIIAALGCAGVMGACAGLGLGDVVQPPRFSVASGRQAELRLLGPSAARPLGGATIRLWAHVENPNPLGLALSAVQGSLALEGTKAANVDFPLGVPLLAGQDTVIPLDINVSFSDLPGLADVAARLLTRSSVNYRLDGTVTVNAGPLGNPRFGPSTLLDGTLSIRR